MVSARETELLEDILKDLLQGIVLRDCVGWFGKAEIIEQAIRKCRMGLLGVS